MRSPGGRDRSIAPAVAIRRKTQHAIRAPRSPLDECYDFLDCFTRGRTAFCPNARAHSKDTVDQVADQVLSQPEASRGTFVPVASIRPPTRFGTLTNCGKHGLIVSFNPDVIKFSTPESLLDWISPSRLRAGGSIAIARCINGYDNEICS